MISLSTPIRALPGLRPDLADKFTLLGLVTVQDALGHFPIRHQDWRKVTSISDCHEGQAVTLEATVISIKTRRAWHRRKLQITEAIVTDASNAKMHIVWFNQPYLAQWYKSGQSLFISGQVTANKQHRLEMHNPLTERPSAQPTHETLVPIYPSTTGLSQWHIRKVLKQAVALVDLLSDPLPADIRQQYQLTDRSSALRGIHFPTSPEEAEASLRRLKFDELLAWQLEWQSAYIEQRQTLALPLPFQEMVIRQAVKQLPYELTDDQRIVAWQVFQDMAKSQAMSRLVQGDVGSGKTVVALLAALNAAANNVQVAFLAPTVVLAEQHGQTFKQLLQDQQVRVAVVAGGHVTSWPEGLDSTDALVQAVADHRLDIVIGTHALLREPFQWAKLGLVMVDEQQRFGVQQREALLDEQRLKHDRQPHFLSFTATPIPRTLALFFAGELAVSTIKQKPPGRLPIKTDVVQNKQDQTVVDALRQTIAQKQQAYVITPLIEESDALGVKAATTEHARLQKALPGLAIGLVHGGLPAEERTAQLEKFRTGQYQILVSTTVIEVGVDVLNATLMIILGAERFGLAQLHQLRGRVGRGKAQGYCLLVTETENVQRLRAVAKTDDGFVLAEQDLQQRGAGELYGLRQSGLPDWQLASLDDKNIMTEAREAADVILRENQNVPEALLLRPGQGAVHLE